MDNRLILRLRGDIIDVDARAIRVKVEGRVHFWRERQIADRVALGVPGVSQVDNQLLIA